MSAPGSVPFTNDDIREVAADQGVCVRPVLRKVLDNCRGTALVVTHREEQLALFDHVHHRGPISHDHVGRVG